MANVVDHLKKVALELGWDNRTVPFEFIVGAASEGLCPFECHLLHRSAGDRLRLSIPASTAGQTFAHLHRSLAGVLATPFPDETVELDVHVLKVEDPKPREVVRAMAQAAEQHGCGGDCGCGCGGP